MKIHPKTHSHARCCSGRASEHQLPESCRARIPHSFQHKLLARTFPCTVHLGEGKGSICAPSQFLSPTCASTRLAVTANHVIRVVTPHDGNSPERSTLDRLRLTPGEDFSPCVCYPQPFVVNSCPTTSAERCERVTDHYCLSSSQRRKIFSSHSQHAASWDVRLNTGGRTAGQTPLLWTRG